MHQRNRGSKVFARNQSIGQSQLTKLKTDDGRIVSSKPELLGEVEIFYGQLYTTIQTPVADLAKDPRAILTRHYTEDNPDVSLYEISMALKQLKNGKAPGDDGITAELLKAGGKPVLKGLQTLFNSVIHVTKGERRKRGTEVWWCSSSKKEEKPGVLMETHVSSTTADVPESQEVISSHGNVELVIVVEKLDEEQPQKADSISQPVAQDSKTSNNQSTKKDGLSQNSPSKQPLQETDGKQAEPCKTVLPITKLQQNKQSTMHSPNKSENRIQNKLPEINNRSLMQSSPPKDPTSQVDVDSTSVKDNDKLVTEQLDEKNQERDFTVTIERESSNDSQAEMECDVSEKEQNKSISRELKSLINSAKESKIISECTKLTSKTRKSRAPFDASNPSLNVSVETDNVQGRCNSDNSQECNSSEKSEKIDKRSMRSQNPEFVNKVKQFLNSVTGKFQKDVDSDASSTSDQEMVDKSKESISDIVSRTQKNKNPNLDQTSTQAEEKSNKLRSDPYCWRCHWAIDNTDEEKTPQTPLRCTVCPRSFHFRCLTGSERNKIPSETSWVCPGCMTVLHAESSETRSSAMKKTSLGTLCELLKFALQRMTEVNGVEPFTQPVDRAVFPDYDKYVVHPMDLSLMRENIDEGLYGSTEAFLGDAHWILHNSIIFNTLQSKLTAAARALVRSCRAEMGEIEACPECYAALYSRRPTWFTDVCSTPHLLLWAKLKGFPYWPAKAMSVSHAGLVDVRFFGAHDRAWVPARDCFLYSKKDPNNFRTKRQDILDSVQEAEHHIRIISLKYGKFVYAPYRIQFEPFKLEEQLKLMIPSFEGTVKSPVRDKRPKTPILMKKSRLSSKGSKDGSNVGDEGSDRELSPSPGVEKMDEDSLIEKSQLITPRKRRRSDPKEIGPPDSCSKEKNKRVDANCKEQKLKKRNSLLVSSSKEESREEIVDANEAGEPTKAAGGSAPAPGSTPSTPIHLFRASKDTPKLAAEKRKRDEAPQLTKTPNKIKPHEKEKTVSQDAKTRKQNARRSRSKSLNNREPIQVESISGADTSSTNKVDADIEIKTPSKANMSVSKNKTEENKSNEKAADPNAATTSDIYRSNIIESSTTTRSNAKEKPNEISSSNKPIEKEKPNKINDKDDKKAEATVVIQKKAKQKSAETVTPNKDSVKVKNTNSPLSKTNTDKEKPNETPLPNNKNSSKEKTANNTVTSNNVEAVNTNAGTGSTEVLLVSKVVESSPVSRKITGKVTVIPEASCSKARPSKDNLVSDEDTRAPPGSRKMSKSPGAPALPTISCVRSLSAAPGTVQAARDSSIFTPTSTDQVSNMKDALNKLQKLKTGVELPQVGRVGVRAFARISPPDQPSKTSDVQVEIKAEPMDYEETEPTLVEAAPVEPARLRPAAPAGNLREVRISKVVAGPVAAKKTAKTPDVRPRAKKTFPQPKKADDGRSELTSKNSMVYIPIQPPAAQAGARAGPRVPAPAAVPGPAPRMTPLLATAVNVSSLSAMGPPPPPPPAPLPAPLPAVPTTVHTVPLITSVNGQWTFSLQPVMSVGGVDSISSPMVNGVLERVTPTPMALSPSLSSGLAAIAAAPPAPPVPPAAASSSTPSAPPAPSPATPAPPALPASVTSTTTSSTTSLADVVLGEPPRLLQRPVLQSPLAASTPVGEVPAPSAAGPLTAKLNQNSVKLADFFRNLLEDSLEQLEEPEAQAAALRLQLEQARWQYQHEVAELRHTQELLLVELRSAMEKEKARAVAETRRLAQQELDAAVRLAKSKQWCANCFQEAQFYCCWNTAYCDYPCQRAHWAQHYGSCTQQRASTAAADARPGPAESARLTSADDVPKPAAPALTAGGKVVRAAPDLSQKARIIVD